MMAKIKIATRQGEIEVVGKLIVLHGVSVVAHKPPDGIGTTITEARTGRAICNGGKGDTQRGQISLAELLLEKPGNRERISQFPTINPQFA